MLEAEVLSSPGGGSPQALYLLVPEGSELLLHGHLPYALGSLGNPARMGGRSEAESEEELGSRTLQSHASTAQLPASQP